jgi:hypothetical protein
LRIDISKDKIEQLKKDSKIKNSVYKVQKEKGKYSFLVSSFTDPEKKYNVFLDRKNKFHCECTGFVYKQNCCHIDSVKKFLSMKKFFPPTPSSDKLGDG